MTDSATQPRQYNLYLLIIIGAVALRGITFLLSTNYGADSITRSLIAHKWSADPFLIWHPNAESSVWLPLQFYLNGALLMIWDNITLVPRLVNFILSMVSLAVFYLLANRLFSKRIAIAALACFAVYTMHIKHGNIASSESMYIFSILAAVYFCERLLRSARWYLAAGLSLSLAGAVMIRFEPWVLPLFMIAASTVTKRNPDDPPVRKTVSAVIAASILPGLLMLLWLYGSYREFGDALYSLHEASVEHVGLTEAFTASAGKLRVLLYNAAFWPGILVISLSPLIFAGGIWGMIRSAITKTGISWVVFTALILGIYYYKSIVTGELAPLARYTILPGTFLCLFAGSGLYDLAGKIRFVRLDRLVFSVLLIGLLWSLLLSGNYSDSGDPRIRKLTSVSPVTNYPAELTPVLSWIDKNLMPEDRVMFSTPAYASNSIVMYSRIQLEQVVPVNETDPADYTERVNNRRPTLLVLHRDSPLFRQPGGKQLPDTLTIGDVRWARDSVVGEFGMYRKLLR